MSRIDELIEQLCPDGVEFRALGEIGSIVTGLTGKSKDDFTPDGNALFVPYKNVFLNPALDLSNLEHVVVQNGERQNSLEKGDIIFTASSEILEEAGMTSVVTADPIQDIFLNSFCFLIRPFNQNILHPDFSKHLFRSRTVRKAIVRTASGVTRFNISKAKLLKISVPVPPTEIQKEIVRLLDSFSELEVELEAELEARQTQYAYHRDWLLSRAALEKMAESTIDTYELGEIASIKTGTKPNSISEVGVSEYPYVNAGTTFSGSVNDYNFDGDTVTTPSRGQGGIGYVGYQFGRFWCGPLCYGIRAKTASISNRYLYYVLQSQSNSIIALMNTGGTPAVNAKDLKRLRILVPPASVQSRIVSILDKFDALVNDLSSGIPAEIEARRKQYEYYRDKLLTFKEKPSD